ncbi:hypothetical protein JCM6882_005427 [Rhodosporidiobolus microsporus]
MSSTANPCLPPPSFVPYATPSISPRPLLQRKGAHEQAMAVAAAPAPPFPDAPPSPPSPPLAQHVSNPLSLFAAEMFVWLWFAPAGGREGSGEEGQVGQSGVVKHQVRPTDRFVRFCHEVLTTTQVSHSVVLLALLFISRLKQRNSINGSPGSEYRLAVTGLMLANKVLDDNTYTAQTWSQVSSLELQPLVAGEAEFLKGLDWSLHITKRDYDSWLKLLEGHVAARNMRLGKVVSPASSLIPSARKIASTKRVRAAQADGVLHGLGIDEGSSHLQVPRSEDEDASGRRTRRRLDGSVSTNTTPTISFTTTFTIPAPATAPHPQPPRNSAPLPLYGQPLSATTSAFPSVDVSPTSLAYTARRNAAARAVSASSATSGTKRRADDAFSSSGESVLTASALPPMFSSSAQGQMSRSFSAGPASVSAPQSARPPTAPSLFVHPAHHVPILPLSLASSPHGSRPSSSSSASSHLPPAFGYPPPTALAPPQRDFQTLSDAFSPRYDPEHHRRLQQGAASLGYYQLAAGHTLGHLRQTLPGINSFGAPAPMGMALPSYALPFHHPTGMSTVSTSPVSEAYSHPYGHALGQPHPAFPQQQPHPHPQHLHAYPTPSLPSYGGAPMVSSLSAQAFPNPFAFPPLASAPAPPTTTQSSPPRYSPTSTAASAVGAGYAAALPAYLQPQARQPQLQTQQPQPAPQGPHPFFSSYSNAGVPGVLWRGAGAYEAQQPVHAAAFYYPPPPQPSSAAY